MQNNLGNAYSQLPAGDRAENLAQAIACYRRALAIPHLAPWEEAKHLYNLACAFALLERAAEACRWLEKAIALDKRCREWAQKDDDFDNLEGEICFEEVVAGRPPSSSPRPTGGEQASPPHAGGIEGGQ